MKKYNIIVGIITFVISLIFILLIYIRFFDEKITIILLGSDDLFIYENEEYYENGFLAFNEDKKNINERVIIESDLNNKEIGVYTVTYTVKTKFRKYTAERIVRVLEDPLKNVEFTLLGNKTINLSIGEEYIDPLFTCVNSLTNEVMNDKVEVINNINNQEEGMYKIEYRLKVDEKEKILTRNVYVYARKHEYVLNESGPTNNDVIINLTSNIYNFSYVVSPSEEIFYENNIQYKVSENGEYKFIIYNDENTFDEYIVNVNNIDRELPIGTCKGVMLDGKTTYTVTSSDLDISKYVYNNEEEYISDKSTYVVPKFIRKSVVKLVDFANNENIIECDMELQSLPVIKPKSGERVKYTATSDSLVLYITKNSGYYLTRIWAKDPVYQMKKELVSGNNYKRPKAILETAVSKNNLKGKIVLGANASAPIKVGSYYSAVATRDPVYNLKEPSSLLVYNGNVIINDYERYNASTVIYYLDGSNQLKYIPKLGGVSVEERKKIFDDAINSGVYNTFAFNMALVVDGKALNVSNDYYALRQGFCQIDSNNFILVTSDTKKWNRPDFAKFLASKGCKTAVNFDGGGSTALFYKKKGSSSVKTLAGNKRSLSSVMYFTELN